MFYFIIIKMMMHHHFNTNAKLIVFKFFKIGLNLRNTLVYAVGTNINLLVAIIPKRKQNERNL